MPVNETSIVHRSLLRLTRDNSGCRLVLFQLRKDTYFDVLDLSWGDVADDVIFVNMLRTAFFKMRYPNGDVVTGDFDEFVESPWYGTFMNKHESVGERERLRSELIKQYEMYSFAEDFRLELLKMHKAQPVLPNF